MQHSVNEEVMKIVEWMRFNKLSLNYSKTKYMLITNETISKPNICKITVGKHKIERVTQMSYLGIILDDKLTKKSHINDVCSVNFPAGYGPY